MKTTIILIIFLYLTKPVFSQEIKSNNYDIGLLLGVNSSYLITDNLVKYDNSIFSFLPGVVVDIKPKNTWRIRSGILYHTLGGKSKKFPITTLDQPEGTGDHYWNTWLISYIELPVHVNYKFSQLPFDILVGGGPSLGWLVSAKEIGDADVNSDEYYNYNYNIKYKFDNFNISLCLSFGVITELTDKFSLELSTEFDYGLTDIYTEQPSTYYNTDNQSFNRKETYYKTRSFTFTVVIKYEL
jgi:hypothetical protein